MRFVGSREVEKLIDASQHLSSLGFDIADDRVGGNAGEIGDVAVNDCLADDRLTAVLICDLSDFVAYDRHDISCRGLCPFFCQPYSNGSMTIEPVVLRPPMNLCAAAASRSEKALTTLLATTPRATASNRDFAAASISLRFDK